MNWSRVQIAVLLVLGLAAMVWATWPPSQVALNDHCEPQQGPPQLSATLYPGPFWRGQLDAIAAERSDLMAQPARRTRLEEESARQTGGIESRMNRLSRDETDDPAEKERREAAQQSTRMRRLAWLFLCETEIRQRQER
ncbi:hypothetical protein [Magnetospirillum molischianum]|uniref:Uncharacterized protein n=1 Tax=Magnetospirillum molischianum DSM 120 TaxID=1150626 RepID=H8FN81_MAGML|nr:hypothetical protein [Magnetospirillum molischianum]CCG39819.1 exported hypothetical protein [Magnetospirillum molischianum DSM 120]